MKQTLFTIPEFVAGMPVFGLGLLLAAWVAFSIGLFVWLLKRHGMGDEVRGYLPLLVLVGLGIVFLLPRLLVAGGLPIRGYGVMMMLGIVSGVGITVRRAPRMGIDPDKVFSLTFWMFAGGIFGARMFHVVQKTFIEKTDQYQTIGDVLSIHEGGLVVLGALIAVAIIVPFFAWRNKLPLLALADLLSPGMVLGLAFGRVGCLLTGCCFGGTCDVDVTWAVTFPQESAPGNLSPPYRRQVEGGLSYGIQVGPSETGTPVITRVIPGSTAEQLGLKPGDRITRIGGTDDPTLEVVRDTILTALYSIETNADAAPKTISIVVAGDPAVRRLTHRYPPRSLPVHPTQIYSAINAALLCCLLLAFYPHRRHDGEVFALLITVYPIARFLLEYVRTDEYGQFGTSLTISQLISLAMFSAAIALWVYLRRSPSGHLWVDRAPAIG